MKVLRAWVLIAAASALAAGCAVWTRVDQPTLAGPSESYFVDAPVGWVQLSAYSGGIRVTRDGFQVQMADVTLTAHDKQLPLTKKASTASILPTELAELLVAELRSVPGLGNLTVKETTPARVAGHDGFRLIAQFRNDRGVAYRIAMYGVALPQGRLVFHFQAIERFFFQRDLPEFEQMVRSYRTRRAS